MLKTSSRLWRYAALLPALFIAASAWGRAGGGEGYSTGSSPSGDSSGDSSGDVGFFGELFGELVGDLIYLLIRLVFEYPVIGVPLLLAVVLWGMVQNRRQRGSPWLGERRMTRTIVQHQEARSEERRFEALDRIRQRDPGFDRAAFTARASNAFLRIQQAWSAQDMRPARAFISDGVMERFAIQLEMQKARGLRNDMGAVRVTDCSVLDAESDAHFDTLHLRISATATDTKVSLADGRRLAGSGRPEAFAEVWSFLRRPGAKTLARPGLIEGCCPSCGAGLDIGDAAQCASCKSWVNSGEYDWVLSEITQTSAWAVRASGAAVPGFAGLAQRDPLLNTQFLEDRASVAFWRWQRALDQRSAKALLPVALPQFCAAWDAEAQSRALRFDEAAVGAVEVKAFESRDELDLAHVAVRWSGTVLQTGAGGSPVLPREHVFVLARGRQVRTDPNAGLSSCRCPNCGAPPSTRDIAACEYCATPFNDGSRQWVIAQILPGSAWRAPQAQAHVPAQPAVQAPPTMLSLGWVHSLSRDEVLAVLIRALLADGSIAPAERKYLDRYAALNQVPPGTVDGLIEAARHGQLQIPRAQTPQEALACLDGLIEMSLADGKLDPAELKLILAYADSNGIERHRTELRIKDRRLSLYRQAQ